ncbi:hypothetical protein M1N93_01530 [Dehalococcoidia bacterium]|nr:hypothetical protein [Dehalococcoidia bacterium]
MAIEKKDWILLALRDSPLDRLHLMKALFLVWNRSGRNVPDYFEFEPYLYGPCSFEVYSVLDDLSKDGLIVQPPHPVQQWANYFLTERGKLAATEAANCADPDILELINKVAQEVAQLQFSELLRRVYSEAPEFAAKSLMGGILKQ